MTTQEELILWLQRWYHTNCDGDWEHNQNIIITTIDNPGWSVTINLEETSLENKPFDHIFVEKDDLDWFCCRIEQNRFLGDCGVFNLLDVIAVFKNFVEEEER